MSKISDQLMQAFEIAMDEKISKLRYDKSIQANIKKIEDASIGKYSVEYTGGVFDAYAEDLSKAYRVGETVWVSIPEGDFSNKKFIRNSVSNLSTSAAQKSELANSIFEVSPNFSDLGYIYNDSQFGLAIRNETKPDTVTVSGEGSEDFQERFAVYMEQYEYIKVAANFKTEFLEQHSIGDYGLIVTFKNLSDQDVAYFLNLRDFNGNPYALTTWSPQFAVLKVPKGQLSNLSSIVFYQTGFDNLENEIVDLDNLFVKDISLSFVEVQDLTEQPYYLSVVAQDGLLFTTTTTTLSFLGQLYYYGDQLNDNCVYQWYEQDLSVSSTSEDYDVRAGWGWKAIEEATGKEFSIAQSEVPWQSSYKLVVVYNDDITMERVFTVTNSESSINLAIVQENRDSGTVILKLNDSTKSGSWYYVSSDGYEHSLNGGVASTSIDATNYLVYSPMTFYCQVPNIGVLSYIMRNFESDQDVTVTFAGENLFTYDANGNYKIQDAGSEKRLEVTTIWNNGVISSDCTVDWLDGEGNILPIGQVIDYTNRNSMFSQVRIVEVDSSRKILYYKIKHKFKLYPEQNNSFRIRITPRGQEPIFFTKQIYFTKIGDPGTNGTTYQVLITSNHKFMIASGNLQLTCMVYKDQDVFNGAATITWELFNLLTQDDQQKVTGSSVWVKADGDDNARYVKVTAQITDGSERSTIYSFYPIYTIATSIDDEDTVDLSLLPKYVQYGSNGLNPQYLRNVVVGEDIPFVINQLTLRNVTIDGNNYLKFPDSFPVKSSASYAAASNVALIELAAAGTTIYYPIVMYMNTFGNEAINNWDGVSVDLGTAADPHVFAPQIGAGSKDSNTNKFTGVIMGKDTSQEDKVGLYGYNKGINTFGLREDGLAYFGSSSNHGRIVIDPDFHDSAVIYGGKNTLDDGQLKPTANGMFIRLARSDEQSYADLEAISVGKDPDTGKANFDVTYDGKLFAQQATIKGTITAAEGSIGGWRITKRTKDGREVTTLQAERTYLDSDGYLQVADGSFSGNISASTINGGVIQGDAYIYGNTIEAGTISSTEISASTITGGTITGTDIYASTFYATSGDSTKYLTITDRGIKFNNTSVGGSWSLLFNSSSTSPSALELLTNKGFIKLNAENDIKLVSGQYIELTSSQGLKLSSTMYGDLSNRPYGVEGLIYFEI